MIEALTTGAFVVAILLMCGPQACYNAGTWVGIIFKALWKAAVWLFRAKKRAATRATAPLEQPSLERMEPSFMRDSNVVPLKSANGQESNDREGLVIEGIATVH